MSWIVECKRKARELTLEKRQEFFGYFRDDGMTIGEAREKAGISSDEATGIVKMNIRTVTVMNERSV